MVADTSPPMLNSALTMVHIRRFPRRLLIVLCIYSLGVQAQLSESKRLRVTQLCEQTLNSYLFARDDGDIARAKDLFTEDASMFIFGRKIEGREAILAAMQQRANQAVWAHLAGGSVIKPISQTRAAGESYALVFEAEDQAASPAASIRTIVKYHDEFVVSQAACLIQSRRVEFRIGQ